MFVNAEKLRAKSQNFVMAQFLQYNPNIKKEDIIYMEIIDEGFEVYVLYKNKDGVEMSMLYDTFSNTSKFANPIDYTDSSIIARAVKYRLNTIMKHQFMNQKTLSAVTGISESRISRFCNGQLIPNAIDLAKMACALKVDISCFFTKYF